MANVTIQLNCTNNTGSAVSYLSIRVAFANNPSILYVWESPQSLATGASTSFTLAVPEGDSPAPISSGQSNVVFYTDSQGITSCAVAILDPDVVFVEGDIYSISLSAADSGGGDEGGGDSGGGGGDTPSGSGIKVTYNLKNFVAAKASSGALCVMTLKNYSSGTITSIDDAFRGAGICRLAAPKTYALTVSSVVYLFNEMGNSVDEDSENYKLHLGEIPQDLTGAGGAVESDIKTVVTRATDGTYTSDTVEQANTVLIESLNARDNFAINALRTIMMRADKDPATLSNNEMAYYCDVAYQWASNMMTAAAKVRATIEDESGPSVDEASLTSNTEKLLYDMSEAIIDSKEIMENLTQAIQDLDSHICEKLQDLVDK